MFARANKYFLDSVS